MRLVPHAGIPLRLRGMGMAVLAFSLAGVALADEPEPVLATGFENPAATKRFFGAEGTPVPGRHGQGLTGATLTFKNPATAGSGTLMAWLKLEERTPAGGFQFRWAKLGGAQIGPLGSTHRACWLGVGSDQEKTLIELGDWHHWACVWNGTKCQLYLDGRLVLDGEIQQPFPAPPPITLTLAEGNRWVIDDLKIYAQALTPGQISAGFDQAAAKEIIPGSTPAEGQPAQTAKAAPAPWPALSGDQQLVENPAFAPGRNDFASGFIPPGWSVGKGSPPLKTDANGASCTLADDKPLSLLATLKRGIIVPGRVYQITAYYRLKGNGGRALLRFRNQIDVGTQEFPLPEGEWRRLSFFASAPEDYDVGLYYLEVFAQGANLEFGLRGLYCREATPEEVKKANLTVAPAAKSLPPAVVPDERWIEELPQGTRFLKPADRRAAWGNGPAGRLLMDTIKQDGNSLWFEHSPREIWDRLAKANAKPAGAIPRLAVKRARSAVPGGNGLDPLPPRSVHAAALLFGIGAVNTGIGSHAFERLCGILDRAGYFDESTEFLPFWGQRGFYKTRYENRESPPDYRELFGGKPGAPLFGHTATGVLVSGYRQGNKLLLVLANTTDQKTGKLGDLWVDHARLFGLKASAIAGFMQSGKLTATDLETGAKSLASWNRNGGGFVPDFWFNVSIAPGDYRLISIEYHP